MTFKSPVHRPRGLRSLIIIGATSAMMTAGAKAEPPHLATYWLPIRLTMKACLHRGMSVLRDIGFQDVHSGGSGKVAFGSRDDNHMGVVCAIPHWVIFVGASPNLDEIANYRNELVKRF